MKRMLCRVTALLLAAAIPLGLAGCGQKPEEVTPAPLSFQPAAFYKMEDVPLNKDGGLWCACVSGGAFYYLLESEDQEVSLYRAAPEDTAARRLEDYAITAPSENVRVFPMGLKSDGQGGLWALETWQIFTYDLPEDFDPETDEKYKYIADREYHGVLRRLDPDTGAAAEERDLSEALAPIFTELLDWAVDGQGRVFLAVEDGVTVLDKKGQELAVLEAQIEPSYSGGDSLVLLSDGSAAALVKGSDKKLAVQVLSSDGKSWSDRSYPVPSGISRLWPGQREFLFLVSDSGSNTLYGQAEEEAGMYKLLDWQAIDANSASVQAVLLLDEDRAALLRHVGNDTTLSLLTPSEAAEDGRTVLTLAAFSSYVELQPKVTQFNDENPDYYIVVRNYAEDFAGSGMTPSEISQRALTRLDMDMISGKVPDLIGIGYDFPVQRYAAKGALEDLWPWIDGDPELGRDRLMTHVLDCVSQGEKLYQVCGGFAISAFAAPAARIGDGTEYTLDGLMDLYDAMPAGSSVMEPYVSPYTALCYLSQYGDSFVDWSQGTCSFDSPTFIRLLELCARQPTEEVPIIDEYNYYDDGGQALREGRQLIQTDIFNNMDQFMANEARCGGPDALWDYPGMLKEQGINRIYNTDNFEVADNVVHGALKDERYAAFLSFPTGDGGTSAGSFVPNYRVSMPADCPHKEGAWAFIRQLLLPGGSLYPVGHDWDGSTLYASMGFPVNKADFEAMMAQKMEPQYAMIVRNGEEELLLGKDGNPVEDAGFPDRIGYPVTMFVYALAIRQSDVDRFMDLYEAVNLAHTPPYDNPLTDILSEQTAPFFAGEISAEQAAKAIQSRAELYLGELS